ncbi:MAG: acetolactate decarboxylase [Kiritimatiellae bacterium]|nr:acetolactate decarboxylase [Kiritimatiellia bacterium]
MKPLLRFLWLCVFLGGVARPACCGGDERDMIFQTAPFQSLNKGVYDGLISYAVLKDCGDFGLGTFNALDGEMVCVDGVFYQIRADGKSGPVPDAVLTPFAMLTFFDEDRRIEAVNAGSLAELCRIIDRSRPTKNLFYALRVDGRFDYLKLRSVPPQKKPYPSLAEALKGQTVFEYKNITGTLAGFWSPSFAEKIGVPGYHFHFISREKNIGGHALDLRFHGLNVRMDRCAGLTVVTPENGDYFSADLEESKTATQNAHDPASANP